MHVSRPVAIRVVTSTALSVMNLLIGSSVLRSTANQRVFPLVLALVALTVVTLAQVWLNTVAYPARNAS
jgi:hypothetical protein